MGKTKDVSHQELMEVINSFDFGGKLEEVGIFGNGHINETYCAVFSTEAGQKRYILQKMNKQIFKDPVGLMENISGVTSWLKKKILEKYNLVDVLDLLVARDADEDILKFLHFYLHKNELLIRD